MTFGEGVCKISSYRIYKYPMRGAKFRHIYFNRTLRGHFKSVLDVETKRDKLREEAAKMDPSLCRSRRIIRDLILCNPFEYFCTFTFAPERVDRYDFAECKRKITKLFMNYKNRYSPSFRYLLVPERHKDGAWHFHGMVAGLLTEHLTVPLTIWVHPYKNREMLVEVPNIHRYVDWTYYSKKLGFFNCSKIKNYEKCAAYVAKYVSKDLAAVAAGKQVVLASKGLHRPELVFDADGVPCDFEPQHEDDFCKIAWLGDDETIGTFLPEWEGECCAELHGEIYEDELAAAIFTPLTGEQLRI